MSKILVLMILSSLVLSSCKGETKFTSAKIAGGVDGDELRPGDSPLNPPTIIDIPNPKPDPFPNPVVPTPLTPVNPGLTPSSSTGVQDSVVYTDLTIQYGKTDEAAQIMVEGPDGVQHVFDSKNEYGVLEDVCILGQTTEIKILFNGEAATKNGRYTALRVTKDSNDPAVAQIAHETSGSDYGNAYDSHKSFDFVEETAFIISCDTDQIVLTNVDDGPSDCSYDDIINKANGCD